MFLIGAVYAGEEALICDLAETYHILDYKQLPLRTVAVLASGLRQDARIYSIMTELKEREEHPSFETASDFDKWRSNILGR